MKKYTLLSKILIGFFVLSIIMVFVSPQITFWMVVAEFIAFISFYVNHRFVMGSFYLFLPALAVGIPGLCILFLGASANNCKYIVTAKVVDFSLVLGGDSNNSSDIMGVYLEYIDIDGERVTSWQQDTDPVVKDLRLGDEVIYEKSFDNRSLYKIRNSVDNSVIEAFRKGIVCNEENPNLNNVTEDPYLRAHYEKLCHHNSFWKFVHSNTLATIIVLLVIALAANAWSDRLSISVLIGISIFVMLWVREFAFSESLALLAAMAFYIGAPFLRMFMCKSRERRDFNRCGGYLVSVVPYWEGAGKNARLKASFTNPLGVADTFSVDAKADAPVLAAVPFYCCNLLIVVDENPSQSLVDKYKEPAFVDSLSNLETADDNEFLRQEYGTYHKYWINEKN